MMKNGRGFSLVELMAVLAATGVLLTISAAGLRNQMEKVHAAQTRSALQSSFSSAMAEATLLNGKTVMCPSMNGATCDNSTVWHRGWLVFLDKNLNRAREADEKLLFSQSNLPENIRLVSSPGRTKLSFQSGGSNAGSNVTFTLCDGRGAGYARSIILSNNGRLRTAPAPRPAANACVLLD